LPCGARTFLGALQGKQEQIPRSNDAAVRPTPPPSMVAQMPPFCPGKVLSNQGDDGYNRGVFPLGACACSKKFDLN